MKRICVIGAGPAGLTAASLLQKEGFQVDVYESDSKVGGMCKTLDLWGQKVDLGPHRFFSRDRRVNEFWLDVVGQNYQMIDRVTHIYYNKKYFSYPLKGLDALRKLGLFEACLCLLSYLGSKFRKTGELLDFESWVISRFGKRLYRIFFKTYSEKLWGIKCTDLDSDFASQRIKKFSMWEAIKSIVSISSEKHSTLIDEFAFPISGTGFVYETLAEDFVSNGGNLFLEEQVRSFLKDEKNQVCGIKNSRGEEIQYDIIIPTMPLTALVSALSLKEDPIRKTISELNFRNTILVYTEIDKEDIFSDQWVYIHSENVEIGRITNFSNWGDGIRGESRSTILCSELWCDSGDDLWSKDDADILALVSDDLSKIGLAEKENILNGKVIRLSKSYPVYERGYKELVEEVKVFLEPYSNILPIGRYGSFKYNNQDHSILMGILVKENIASNAGHELWEVNTDYEAYQETTSISAGGLAVE